MAVGRARRPMLAEVAPRSVVEHPQQGEDVAIGGDVPGNEGPGHAELARGPQDPAEGVGRSELERPDAVGGSDAAPVPELESHRGVRPDQGSDQRGEGGGDAPGGAVGRRSVG